MGDIYGTKREHFTLFGIGAGWLIGVIVLLGAIGIGLWAFGVFTSDIKGAGGAIKQRNSTVNRIEKQEMFEQLAADYDGYLVKITTAKAAVVGTVDPIEKGLRQTELLGLRQTCIDAAQQFNAESRKYTSRVWKSAGLPLTLDPKGCNA